MDFLKAVCLVPLLPISIGYDFVPFSPSFNQLLQAMWYSFHVVLCELNSTISFNPTKLE